MNLAKQAAGSANGEVACGVAVRAAADVALHSKKISSQKAGRHKAERQEAERQKAQKAAYKIGRVMVSLRSAE